MKRFILVFLSAIVFLCGCDTLGNVDERMEDVAGDYGITKAWDYRANLLALIPPASIIKDGGKWYFECECPTNPMATTSETDLRTEHIRCEMEWNEAAGQYLFVNNEKVTGYDIFVFNPTKNTVTYGSIIWTKK